MIDTSRLRIQPLSHQQLLKYIRCDNSLETELQVIAHPRSLSPELIEAMEQTILPNVADPFKNYLFHTLWTAIAKEHNTMIGDLCFVGEPNDDGEVEIGYGTYPDFQGKGYMTELVAWIITWAASQPSIKSIIASTEKANVASHKVLIKNQFVKIGETEAMIQWRRLIEFTLAGASPASTESA